MQQFTVLIVNEQPSDLAGALIAHGWDVHQATSTHEALAMLVYHLPHLTILDGDSAVTRQAFWHMVNVTGPSPRLVDLIVSLTDDPLIYEAPAYLMLRSLPASTHPLDLLALLPALLDEQAEQIACRSRQDVSDPAI